MTCAQAPARRWMFPLVALLALGWLALTAVSPSPARAQAQAVAIVDFAFDPATLEVPVGTTVTWTNQGAAPHTVTADDGTFDSGTLQPGGTFSMTFDTPGTFTYHCEIHPSMTATIVVTPAATVATTAPTVATTAPTVASPVGAVSTVAAVTPTAAATTAAPTAAPAVAGRPAHIHTGDCVNLGDIVAPLTDLSEPAGQEEGQADRAIAAESSFTNVPLTLDAMLAADHAVNVHLSADQIGTYIACGEIGGVRDANGALTIGLRELNDSGFTGIAFLAPAADGASTDVSVFIAGTQGQQQEAATAAAAGTAAASAPVAVSLSEFAIDMPDSLPAGPTTFEVTNDGTIEHSFEIEGQGIEEELEHNLQPGETLTLQVDLAPGTYEVYCPVDDHRGEGMERDLTVS
jgi:plastocyanin